MTSNIHRSSEFLSHQYRVKSAVDKGTPPIPSRLEHSNVYRATDRPLTDPSSNYWGYVGTVWDFLYDNCKAINPQASSNFYQIKPEIWEGEALRGYTKTWLNARFYYQLLFAVAGIVSSPLEDWELDELSRAEANYWLKNIYAEGRMSNAIAQTRIASSYGFLQLLYTTATGEQAYPVDASHRPEDIQVPETVFKYAVPYLKKQLDKQRSESRDPEDHDWARGFEETLRIALNMYNGKKEKPTRFEWKYGGIVLDFSRDYTPENK